MTLTPIEVGNFISQRDARGYNAWQVFIGPDSATATQVLNDDGSTPLLRQKPVNNKMMAYDANLTLDVEIYRLTWATANEPDVNASYWISMDGGATRKKVSVMYKEAKGQGAFWWLFFKRSG